MNTKGKIALIAILSVILVVCIIFTMVLTLCGEPDRVPTEQTETGLEETIENSESASEPTEGESIAPQKKAETEVPEKTTLPEPETEPATQAPTQPELPTQPVTKPKEEPDDTTPPPQTEPTEAETTPPTEPPTEPTQPAEGGQGNAEWGNAGAED